MPTPIDYTWPAVILWIGFYQSLMLAPVLWVRRGENQLANRLLAVFIALMGVRLLGLLGQEALENWPAAVQAELINPLIFLYGPLFYFYLRAFLERKFRFRRVHLWHLAPVLLPAIGLWWLPESMLSPAGVQAALVRHDPYLGVFLFSRLVFGLAFLGYLFWGLRLIWRFRRRVQEEASFSEDVHLRWLVFLAGVLLLPFFSVLLAVVAHGPPSGPGMALRMVAPYPAYAVSLMMVILALVTMTKPEVLNGLPEVLKVEDEDALEPPRYESSALTEEQKARYLARLETHMAEAQPYLDPLLTLSSLADQLGLNNKYLSQVINEKREQHFLDFINGYRIARAQELLRSPAYAHYTIVAISYEVGFKSKSAFYTAFKKKVGMTPSDWRKVPSEAS